MKENPVSLGLIPLSPLLQCTKGIQSLPALKLRRKGWKVWKVMTEVAESLKSPLRRKEAAGLFKSLHDAQPNSQFLFSFGSVCQLICTCSCVGSTAMFHVSVVCSCTNVMFMCHVSCVDTMVRLQKFHTDSPARDIYFQFYSFGIECHSAFLSGTMHIMTQTM